jgi:Zn-finger nucleic acid-binding protein
MELFATRGYFFCRYCGSFHFPESVDADGIRVLSDGDEQVACAVCHKPLVQAVLDDAHPVRFCKNCRGVLMPRRSFASVVEHRRAWATNPPRPPVLLDRQELDRPLTCPVCHARMLTHPYYGPGNVIMDNCETCQLVWLDFGELKQIVDAPGQDRGSREQVARSTGDTVAGGITGARMVGGGFEERRDGPADAVDLLARLFESFDANL